MENWSIGKTISGCQVFQEPSLSNASIRRKSGGSICYQAVLPKLHHSSTPLLHKILKFQEIKSPLGMTKAGSSGPGFLHFPTHVPLFIFPSWSSHLSIPPILFHKYLAITNTIGIIKVERQGQIKLSSPSR